MPCLHRDAVTRWSVSARLFDAWHVCTSHVFLHSSLSWALPDAFFVCRCTAIRERWHVRWHVRGMLLLSVIDRWWHDTCLCCWSWCMCDYFRSLSGLRYQCRAYHLCWLRCDFDTRTLPQMTQVTVMILATHYYIATSSCYHNRHCNIAHDHVTCMITSAFRVVISSIINWISWFWPPCHCHRAC